MFSRWSACGVAIYLLGACGSGSPDTRPDGQPDNQQDAAPVVDEHLVPISVSGTTPIGSLDGFPFARASYDNCGERFLLDLRTTTFRDQGPYIEISFRVPEDTAAPVTGPLDAQVKAVQTDASQGWTETSAAAVFDAASVDPPRSSGRVSGTVTTTAPGWMLDFSVDLAFYQQSPNHGGCTL